MTLNRQARNKIAKLKVMLRLGIQTIEKEGYENIKKAVRSMKEQENSLGGLDSSVFGSMTTVVSVTFTSLILV